MGHLDLTLPFHVYYVLEDGDRDSGSNEILTQLMKVHEGKIKRFLKSKLKSSFEVDDIYQEALIFLATREVQECDDYVKYMWGCIQIMLKRHFSKVHKEKDIITFNSSEFYMNYYNVEDTVENAYECDYRYSENEIREKIMQLEHLRYEYDYDIFTLLYLRFKIEDNEKFHKALYYLFGEVNNLDGYNSIGIKQLIHMILQSENGLDVLREYVYCVHNIDNLIENI